MQSMLSDILSPLQRRPLLCLAVCWAAGILLSVHLAIPWAAWLLAAILLLAAWACTIPVSRAIGYLCLGLAVIGLAAGVSAWRLAPPSPDDLRYLPFGGVVLRGYALAAPTPSSYGWRTTFRVTERREGGQWQAVRTDVYLSGQKDAPQPGAVYQILGEVVPVRAPGNPYDFCWQSYLNERGLTYQVRAGAVTSLSIPAPTPWLGHLRARCSQALAQSMPGTFNALHAQLLEGLILGVYGSPLPDQLTEQFRRAGTIHLMVVSGSQVALLGGIFLVPLLLLPYGGARTSYPRLRVILLLLSLPVLALYVVLADRGPSVDRALLMVLLAVLSVFFALSPLARARSYHPDRLTLLASAGLILIICQPAMLFSPGMQLSFAAVFGLLTVTPVLLRCWPRTPLFLTLPLCATLGAQLMTLPVLAWHFGVVPLFAPLTNLIAVPVVGLLLPLGLLAMLCALVIPTAAVGVNFIIQPLLALLLFTNRLASDCPWGQLTCYLRSPWLVLCYFALLGLCMKILSNWLHRRVQGWDVPAGREPRMW